MRLWEEEEVHFPLCLFYSSFFKAQTYLTVATVCDVIVCMYSWGHRDKSQEGPLCVDQYKLAELQHRAKKASNWVVELGQNSEMLQP